MLTYIPVSRARRIVAEAARPVDAEFVPLDAASGRVLAEYVDSSVELPAFDHAAMDGFAVRSADVHDPPVHLLVRESVAAGDVPSCTVDPGTCTRIMTGAPVPEGADAIVPVEWTRPDEDGGVCIRRQAKAGANVRSAGTDIKLDQRLLDAGRTVTPAVTAVLAAAGRNDVRVYRRPVLAVLATGDELVDPSAEPGPGQIRNSNGPALTAHAAFSGASVTQTRRVGDHPQRLAEAIERVGAVDILVMSGGVSVGDRDFVQDVLRDLGAELYFWKVQQRPGKPLLFGRLNRMLVFGLPGNPAAASVCFVQYVDPALRVMTGRQPSPALHAAVSDGPLPKKAGLTTFLWGRAAVDGQAVLRVRSAGSQSSGRVLSQAEANCIVHLTAGTESVNAGDPVHIEWLPWATGQVWCSR